MNIRRAIFRAAKHIEKYPRRWQYMSITVPKGCGTPACALGWIGYFAGLQGQSLDDVARAMGLRRTKHPRNLVEPGLPQWTFYQRINRLVGKPSIFDTGPHLMSAEPREVATLLRQYADKYHPLRKAA